MSLDWAIITPEYPPDHGGIADYTAQLAEGLCSRGDRVEVWSPRGDANGGAARIRATGVSFGARTYREVETALRLARPDRILVQYAPAYGRRAVAPAFASWIQKLQPRPWVMFHEVAYPREAAQPLRHRARAWLTRRMAARIARAAERIFVSIPAWAEWLEILAPEAPAALVLPVPSNLPLEFESERVAAWRKLLAPDGGEILGYFGSHHPYVEATLRAAVPALLQRRPGCRFVLAGGGASALASALKKTAGGERIVGQAYLEPPAAAALLGALDALLLPFPDGVSGRRGSAMAALALGCPLAATNGPNSEPFWRASDALELVDVDAPEVTAERITTAVEGMLDGGPQPRLARAQRGRKLYADRFALDHTLDLLRAAAPVAATSLTGAPR